jgi:hypothetical protein
VVLPILKIGNPAKFSDYRPISLLVCLSKVFEVLTVFQSGFRLHHSTVAAVLKVTEDIRLSMEDGQVTVLLLLDFSQAYNIVVHGLLLCNL